MTIEEIAEMAQNGEDVSSHFTGNYQAKQGVLVDFPLELLRLIDAESQALGISRRLWIQRACAAQLHQGWQEESVHQNGFVHTH